MHTGRLIEDLKEQVAEIAAKHGLTVTEFPEICEVCEALDEPAKKCKAPGCTLRLCELCMLEHNPVHLFE